MAWLKRNLFMVIGGVVALALLGVAGWYLYSQIQNDDAVAAELQTATEELQQLVDRDPHPGNAKVNNIAAAKADVARLTGLKNELMQYFEVVPATVSTNQNRLNPAEFKRLLENTIVELEREAKKVSVQLPESYAFSFSEQRKKVQFAPNSLEPLASELMDVKAITMILLKARVNQVLGFRRSPVSDDPMLGGADYLSRKMVTNTTARTVTTSYEVKFTGFSSDLAAVLEELVKASGCFIVKSVAFDRAAGGDEGDDMSQQLGGRPGAFPGGMDPALAARYGLGRSMPSRYGRYGGGPPPGFPPPQLNAPPPGPKPGVFLDESKVEFTLNIDTVRVLDTAKSKPGV